MATLNEEHQANTPAVAQDESNDGSSNPDAGAAGITVVKSHDPRDGVPGWRFVSILIAGLVGGLVHGYDISNVANIQATLHATFGHIELLPFIPMSYAMASGCGMPLVRKLSDFTDLRFMMVFGIFVFTTGAIVCGTAESMNSVIIGRVVKGLSGSFLLQIVTQYVVLFSRPAEMAAVQGALGLAWVVGLLLGPILGAEFAENEHLTWRWTFYIIPPFIVGILLPCSIAAPVSRVHTGKSLKDNLATVDWMGWILHTLSLVLFSITVLFSGSTWPWSSGQAIALWVITILVVISYIGQQVFSIFTTPERRLIPIDLLANRTVLLVCIATSMTSVAYGVILYYIPLFFAFARGDGPIPSAIRLLPYLGSFIAVVAVAGAMLPKVRRYAIMYMASGLMLVGAGGFLVTIGPSTSDSKVMGVTALLGIAVGIAFPIGISISTLVLPRNRSADAGLLNSMCMTISITIFVDVGGSIYQNVGFNDLQAALGPFGLSDDDIREALAGVSSQVFNSTIPQVQFLTVEVVTSVLAKIFYIVVASGAVTVIAAACMRWEALDFERHVPAEMENVEEVPAMSQEGKQIDDTSRS